MTSVDRAILNFLTREPRPLSELLAQGPKATVYRRLSELRTQGLVVKHGRRYALTSAGEQAKATLEGETFTDALGTVYPPLMEIPTRQHRAMVELALGAIVLRQLTDQEDRHSGFALLGPTMGWKTSAGEFICLASGADPARCIVECAAESGKSLFVRRGSTGEIVAWRDLLDGPVVVLDDYHLADAAVRRAIAPCLAGRRRVPIENNVVTIRPVPIITMNPREGTTLSARTSLSVAQLRRLLPLDVGALQLPDLALHGRRALDAARRHGSLALRAPRGPGERFRPAVVRLLRQVLHPEASGLVDVDLVLGLARGLTAWLADREAMRLAMYDVLLMLETVGWVKAGWVEFVRGFADEAPNAVGEQALVPVSQTLLAGEATARRVALFPERSEPPVTVEARIGTSRESFMPALNLSDRTRRKLVWLSEEIRGRSLDDTVMVLIKTFVLWRSRGGTFDQLRAIVRLREQCETTEVEVDDLRQFLEQLGKLRRHGLQVEDVPAALQVAEDLDQAGLTLPEARAAAELMTTLSNAGVDTTLASELQTALEQYRRLGYAPEALARMAELAGTLDTLGLQPEELGRTLEHLGQLRALGFDEDAARQVARGLDAAGVQGKRRMEILKRLPEAAATLIEIEALEARCRAVAAELPRLEAERTKARGTLNALRERQAAVVQREQASATRHEALEKECLKQQEALAALQCQAVEQQDALAAAEALTCFMLGQPDADTISPFLTCLASVKRHWSGHWPEFEARLTDRAKQMIREFLERIAPSGPPSGGRRQA